jgi:predicted anti-sigma-YlaC factor YlaD
VKEETCQVVSKEELVAYADGELSSSEAEQIAAHVADCERCRTILDALERSLHVTQVIWQTGEAQWPKTLSPNTLKPSPWPYWKVTAVAASILLALGIGLTWRLLSEPSERPGVMDKEPTAAEIEAAANRAALAAQMLAVADLLFSQPGGEQYAVKRYGDLITSFPETQQSAEARLHLKRLLERRTK